MRNMQSTCPEFCGGRTSPQNPRGSCLGGGDGMRCVKNDIGVELAPRGHARIGGRDQGYLGARTMII